MCWVVPNATKIVWMTLCIQPLFENTMCVLMICKHFDTFRMWKLVTTTAVLHEGANKGSSFPIRGTFWCASLVETCLVSQNTTSPAISQQCCVIGCSLYLCHFSWVLRMYNFVLVHHFGHSEHTHHYSQHSWTSLTNNLNFISFDILAT